MGEVVRPDFHHKSCVISRGSPLGDDEPRKVFGEVGPYRVALYFDGRPGLYPVLKVKLVRSDTGDVHPLATLAATQEGHFEAHAIAAAVLKTLRVTALPGPVQ